MDIYTLCIVAGLTYGFIFGMYVLVYGVDFRDEGIKATKDDEKTKKILKEAEEIWKEGERKREESERAKAESERLAKERYRRILTSVVRSFVFLKSCLAMVVGIFVGSISPEYFLYGLGALVVACSILSVFLYLVWRTRGDKNSFFHRKGGRYMLVFLLSVVCFLAFIVLRILGFWWGA